MVILDGESLRIEDVVRVVRKKESVTLSPQSKKRIVRARAFIEEKVKTNEVIYGVNTGFGELRRVKIASRDIRKLQSNLLRSHAVGVGALLDSEIVRAMMLLRANTFAKGYSGVRLCLVETLVKMLNKDVLPLIPSQGSVGASGDLAPLAHMGLGLVGEGDVFYQGKRQRASTALRKAGITPITLEAKEGLAFINGTQLMTAIGSLAVTDAYNIAVHADVAAALSTDVMKGSCKHTDPSIHRVRPFVGQKQSAALIARLMHGSKILHSHDHCDRVQDAYSLRAAPQVHGASRDAIRYAHTVIETEMNSATDNPLVFADQKKILNGANFHGQPVALAMDFLGIALAEFANISERRIARLTDSKLSEFLPPFLVENGGLNSGLMITQYTAAALVSENKVLAHPSSVDSVPTSANQEDHVSMGTIGARKCREILQNTTNVIAVELLCGAQALDFHKPLRSSDMLMKVHDIIRTVIPVLTVDRILHHDLVKMKELVESRKILKALEAMNAL